MGEDGQWPAKSLKDLRLARCVVEVVVAPNDMCDAHVMIIDHHRQIVSRRPVRTEKDEVVQGPIGKPHVALHRVAHKRFTVTRGKKSNYEGSVWRRFGWIAL